MIKILYVGLFTTFLVYAETNPFALDENMQKIEQSEVRLLESLKPSSKVSQQHHSVKKKKQKSKTHLPKSIEHTKKKMQDKENQANIARKKKRKAERVEAMRLKHQAALKRAKERRAAQIRHREKLNKAQLDKKKLQMKLQLAQEKVKEKATLTLKKKKMQKQAQAEALLKENTLRQAYLDAIKEVE